MAKRTLFTALLVGLVALPPAFADEEFDKLRTDYDDAMKVYRQKIRELRKDSGVIEADKLPPDPTEDFLPRFRKLAEKHAGEPAAIAPLALIANKSPRNMSGREDAPGRWAIDRLLRDHATDAALKEVLPGLRMATYTVGAQPMIPFYETVIERNRDDEAVATATFNLAHIYNRKQRSPTGERVTVDRAKALELFRKVVKDHEDSAVAERAAACVFEHERLQLGMVAPDIVGTDVEDREIRLSQFRGQVVVLDFWGFW